ncbi:monooxygenase [Mycobacterium sp. 1164966.3]|uniref:FAD-dependent monooxygenase n=1 Tax=Mycobacterium sp. 1164966.3 TaxID=1856861 RepID=UPI0007FBE9F6|nr:FAD-dependent monooxygenase [Mycobacterium sp. 1164966.3]OBA78079.1 monooxygenase [Mycobacterium sp. 1164966.3]
MSTVDVVVVGAGPTGLMLACELAMRGVRVRVLEERGDLPNITRAFGLHARTLELLDARDMADEIVQRGVPVREVVPAPGATLNLRELPSRYPMVLIAPQSLTERVLSARASQLGVDVAHGNKVVGLEQDQAGVAVRLADGTIQRADYVVGCDGARSAVRRLLDIDFVGKQYQTHILLADVHLAQPPSEGLSAKASADGVVLLVPFGDGWFRAIAWDRTREQAPLSEPVTLSEIRAAFLRIAHTDFGMADMRWSSRFLSERRQARRYRVGRAFIAGDAAHVHSPLGAQGMNTGIQDAMNLGWKLAQAVGGSAPPWLLDSYEEERHTVGANVLKLTDGFNQLVLGRSLLRRVVRRVAITLLLNIPATRHMLEGRLSGIGIKYPHPRNAHPLTGHRMPDIDCSGTRLYELMRDGRFILLTRDKVDIGRFDVTVAVHVHAGLPSGVLVRPDGYVAWAGEQAEAAAAVDHWCGATQPSANPTK